MTRFIPENVLLAIILLAVAGAVTALSIYWPG